VGSITRKVKQGVHSDFALHGHSTNYSHAEPLVRPHYCIEVDRRCYSEPSLTLIDQILKRSTLADEHPFLLVF